MICHVYEYSTINSPEMRLNILNIHITQHDLNFQAGFVVSTAVAIKVYIFWDITPCSTMKGNRRFGSE